MKVGDAGEAFFVFETEQEVPEEFATSPLAGPSQSKSSEDEIDFLDLAQGGSPSLPPAVIAPPSPPDEMGKLKNKKGCMTCQAFMTPTFCVGEHKKNRSCGFFLLFFFLVLTCMLLPLLSPRCLDTGYVSAHSGHGIEFDEEEHDNRSPQLNSRRDYSVNLDGVVGEDGGVSETLGGLFDLSELQPMRPRHLFLEGSAHSSRSRFSFSMSLPSSPVLKAQAQDIMDNFQPIDSAGPFEEGIEPQGNRRYLPSTPVASEGSHSEEFQTLRRDHVIMDMTGYKTDDSAETDLDSDDPSGPRGNSTSPRIRRKKKSKRLQRFLPFSAIHDPDLTPRSHDSTAETDPRLPTRPIQHPTDRAVSGTPIRKRSSSLPGVLGQGVLGLRSGCNFEAQSR